MSSAEEQAEAQKLFDLLKADANCKSLLGNNLNADVLKQCLPLKTKFGGTIKDCIRSGCENTDSGVGVYACDPEGYTTFAPLLDAVIKDYHKVSELNHPEPDFGDVSKLASELDDLDALGPGMIVSTRVRVGRSHDSFGFPPVLTKEDRVAMEAQTVEALKKLDGELKGSYYPLTGMSKETQKQLTEDHFLFNDSDRFLRAAGGYNDWPTGRGIFHNDNKTFLVWVNEEDHLRFISMQMGGNLVEVYTRLVKGIEALSNSGLSFAKRAGLGYLTFCPSNLGTTCRASVHIKIPKVAATPEFKAFCDSYNIQARGIHGEHTESVGGVYDISNKRRLGLTEIEAIKEMHKGVKALIEKEKSL
jgi:arginine kinase